MPIEVDKFPSVPTLKYSDARSQIRSGDILMCAGKSMYSRLIKFATGSIWTHVAFILRLDAIDRIFVFESVETIGVRCVPLSFYVKNYDGKNHRYNGGMIIGRHTDLNESHIKNFSTVAVDFLGYRYGTLDIAKITARILRNKFISRKECRAPTRVRKNEYICSEYAYECFKSVDVGISHDCLGFVTPADFAKTEEVNAVCEIR